MLLPLLENPPREIMKGNIEVDEMDEGYYKVEEVQEKSLTGMSPIFPFLVIL